MSLNGTRLSRSERRELDVLDAGMHRVPEWLRPAAGWSDAPAATGGVVFCNNIVTPYTNRLFNGAAEAGLKLTVVSAAETEPNRAWGALAEKRYDHVVLPGRRVQLGPGRFAHFNSGIFRTLNALKPRLLVINGFYPTMLVAALWAMLTHTRMVLSIDGWAETMPNSIYHRLVRPFVLRHVERVIVPGRKGREYFRGQGIGYDRIATVPLVPAWDAPDAVPAMAGRRFDLLWCGHLNNDAKNAAFLVAVCRELKATMPELSVRIVGQGPAEAETLKALATVGVNVVHDRALPWDRMGEVFSSSKLLVFPSLWEPWGLVCNEAMQCGTPVLASPHVGAGDDLVRTGETGAVLPLDAVTWAGEIRRLLGNERDWTRLSGHARAEMQTRPLSASIAAFVAALA